MISSTFVYVLMHVFLPKSGPCWNSAVLQNTMAAKKLEMAQMKIKHQIDNKSSEYHVLTTNQRLANNVSFNLKLCYTIQLKQYPLFHVYTKKIQRKIVCFAIICMYCCKKIYMKKKRDTCRIFWKHKDILFICMAMYIIRLKENLYACIVCTTFPFTQNKLYMVERQCTYGYRAIHFIHLYKCFSSFLLYVSVCNVCWG